MREGTIDIAEADAACLEHLNPARSSVISSIPVPAPAPAAATPAAPTQNAEPADTADMPISYHAARTMREKYEALGAKAEYLQTLGELVEAAPLQQASRELGREVRDALLNIAARIAPLVAAETDPRKVDEMLTQELRQVCDHLAAKLAQRFEFAVA